MAVDGRELAIRALLTLHKLVRNLLLPYIDMVG